MTKLPLVAQRRPQNVVIWGPENQLLPYFERVIVKMKSTCLCCLQSEFTLSFRRERVKAVCRVTGEGVLLETIENIDIIINGILNTSLFRGTTDA